MKHRINTLGFALSLTLICLFLRETWLFIPLLVLVSIIFITALSLGVLFMQFNYFLKSTTRLKDNKCLLTFDDGPDPDNTPKILDILAKHNIKAVFFLIGEKVEQHPELTKRIKNEGHLLGNHSHTHNNFMSMFSKAKLREEIDKTQQSIRTVTDSEVQYFRPPIGYTNPKYAVVLRERKLKCVGWTLRSYDSVFTDPLKLEQRLLTKIKPGNIVLLHDNLEVTAAALDSFISKAKTNGIIFASSSEINTIIDA